MNAKPDSLWRKTENTDLTSFRRAISRSINSGAISPMAAEAAEIHEAILPYGLTRLAAAQLWMERKNDTWKPDYGLDASFRNPWAMKGADGKWLKFSSYRDAAKAWADRVTKPWGPYAPAQTILEYLSIYAPATDSNDPVSYAEVVCREINALPIMKGTAVATNPFRAPSMVYDIRNDADAARFSLTPAERDRLLGKCIPMRNGQRPAVIVLHIQDGVSGGSLDWWANNVNASSTVLINKDGSLIKCIGEEHGPWTNGPASNDPPNVKGQYVIQTFGPNPNVYSLTIEAEGRSSDVMSQAQLETVCWQVREWQDRYKIPNDLVIRHADLNTKSRSYCPGPYYDEVMARIGSPTQQTWSGKPSWLPSDLIRTLFPEATPGGLRTTAWLAWCAEVGRAPRRVAIHNKDTPQEIIEFSDGLLIFKNGMTSYEQDL